MFRQDLVDESLRLNPYEREELMYKLLKDKISQNGNGNGYVVLRKQDGSTLGYFVETQEVDAPDARNGEGNSVN